MADNQQVVADDSDKHFQTDHLMSDLRERSARSGGLALSTQGIKFVLGTASTIILARLLTPEDYGVVGMVAIVLNFAAMFQYLGLSGATVQWSKLNHKQVSTLFWINLGLSVGIALCMTAMAPVIAWFFREPRVIGVTLGYALTVFITGLWIQHQALLNRQMRFGALAVIDVLSLLLALAVAIITARNGAGYWALVYNHLVTTAVQTLGYWGVCRWRPGMPSKDSDVRQMLAFGGHLTGSNLMNFVSRNLDTILIGKFWGSLQLGLYSRAYQLLLLPTEQLMSPISSVALPALGRLSDSPERYRSAYLNILEKIAMLTMPGIVSMVVMSDWLILLLLGPQWIETGRIFMFLGISATVQPVNRTFYWLFVTQGRTREMFRWSTAAAVIAVLSICAGLPWGAVGVAATYAVTDFLLHTPLFLWYACRKSPVSTTDIYRTLIPSICASVASLLGLLAARQLLIELDNLALRLVLAFSIAAASSLITYIAIPSGRRSLLSAKDLLLSLLRNKRSEPIS
jgi:O-antigen/teichoic acid export membrane protein